VVAVVVAVGAVVVGDAAGAVVPFSAAGGEVVSAGVAGSAHSLEQNKCSISPALAGLFLPHFSNVLLVYEGAVGSPRTYPAKPRTPNSGASSFCHLLWLNSGGAYVADPLRAVHPPYSAILSPVPSGAFCFL
jgi:hypothetical protein